MAEAGDRPAAGQPVQRGDLHRGQGGITERHRHDADADAQPFGPGERGGRGRHPTGEKAVLPEPELLEAGLIGGAGDGAEAFGRVLRKDDGAEGGHAPILAVGYDKIAPLT